MNHLTHLALALFLAAALSHGQDRRRKPLTPKETFAKMAEAAQRPDTPAFRGLFSADAFGRTRGIKQDEARRDLASTLENATVTDVRQAGADAIVVFANPADRELKATREIELQLEGSYWLIKNARTYTVSGLGLKHRQGKKTARARLMERTVNGPYGASAYSFTYVTGDAAKCKNRMDVWFCHHGDFHTRNRIADLGTVKLASVKGIPIGVEWKQWANVEKGHIYVLLCQDVRDRDFYVKFRVKKKKRGAVELEWTILAEGFGAPPSIHEANPLLSNDGADGADGLCGGKMR